MEKKTDNVINVNQVVNNGQHFGSNILVNGPIEINSIKHLTTNNFNSLIEKTPCPNILIRGTVTVIKILIDIIVAVNTLSKGLLSDLIEFLFTMTEKDKFFSWEYVLFVIKCFALPLLIMLTMYLIASTYSLIATGRFLALRRDGLSVYKVKTKRCPICNAKTELEYENGNYVVCKSEKIEHRWPVYFIRGK